MSNYPFEEKSDARLAFENDLTNDEDLRFTLRIRSVKQLGFWAADQLGMTGDDAECYAGQVVDADFAAPGVQDVFQKIEQDFNAQNVDADLTVIEKIYAQKRDTIIDQMITDNA